MRNTPPARFLIRLRKVIWLLPLAAAAGWKVLEQTSLSTTATKYLPAATRFFTNLAETVFPLSWLLLTFYCSSRVAAGIVRARKIPSAHRADATLAVGVLVFFGYSLAAVFIMRRIYQ